MIIAKEHHHPQFGIQRTYLHKRLRVDVILQQCKSLLAAISLIFIQHTGSFDPADQDYDEYELGRLLFAARILPYVNSDPKIQTTDRIPLYN